MLAQERVLQFVEFLKGKLTAQLTNRIIYFPLDWLHEFDEDYYNDFIYNKQKLVTVPHLVDCLTEIRNDSMIQGQFILNFIPSKKMPYKYLDSMMHQEEGHIFRVQGYLDTGESYIIKQYRVVCDECKNSYIETRRVHQCKICDKMKGLRCFPISKSYVSLEFSENYPGRTINQSIPALARVFKKLCLIETQRLVAQKIDVVARLKYRPVGKSGKHKPFLYVLGIHYTKGRILTKQRKEELEAYLQENSGSVLQTLSDHIFRDHKGDEYIKLAMLICAIGLNKKDSQLVNKSLQMVFMWIGVVGKGKSTLFQTLMRYFDIASYVTKMLTQVGLDGGIDKNEHGQHIYRAGELLRCNGGVMFCDEIGMWSEEKLNTLSTVISEQKVTVTKILRREFDVHVNLILGGNAPGGEFDSNKTLFENLGGTKQINDRVTITVISDQAVEDESELSKIFDYAVGYNPCKAEFDDEFIKDLIKYIREHKENPVFKKELSDKAKKRFMELTMARPHDDGYHQDIQYTRVKRFMTRQWIDFFKVSKTIARIEGHSEVSQEDVDKAFEIMVKASYKKLMEDYGDVGLQVPWLKQLANIKEKRTKPRNLSQFKNWIMKKVYDAPGKVFKISDIEQQAEEWGIGHDVDKALNELYYREKRLDYVDRDEVGVR